MLLALLYHNYIVIVYGDFAFSGYLEGMQSLIVEPIWLAMGYSSSVLATGRLLFAQFAVRRKGEGFRDIARPAAIMAKAGVLPLFAGIWNRQQSEAPQRVVFLFPGFGRGLVLQLPPRAFVYLRLLRRALVEAPPV